MHGTSCTSRFPNDVPPVSPLRPAGNPASGRRLPHPMPYVNRHQAFSPCRLLVDCGSRSRPRRRLAFPDARNPDGMGDLLRRAGGDWGARGPRFSGGHRTRRAPRRRPGSPPRGPPAQDGHRGLRLANDDRRPRNDQGGGPYDDAHWADHEGPQPPRRPRRPPPRRRSRLQLAAVQDTWLSVRRGVLEGAAALRGNASGRRRARRSPGAGSMGPLRRRLGTSRRRSTGERWRSRAAPTARRSRAPGSASAARSERGLASETREPGSAAPNQFRAREREARLRPNG